MAEEDVLEQDEQEENESEETEVESEEDVDWKARALKAEKTIVDSKKREKKEKPKLEEKTDEIPEWGQKIIQGEEKRDFGYQKGFSPQVVDALYRYNGGKTPNDEFLEQNDVKALIKSFQSDEKVERNTPKGASGAVYKGKDARETLTDTEATKDDQQKAFEAIGKKHGIST